MTSSESGEMNENPIKGAFDVFDKAIAFFGGQMEMAAALAIHQSHISLIKNRKRSITLELAIAIQSATSDVILASDLRPDKKDELTRAR